MTVLEITRLLEQHRPRVSYAAGPTRGMHVLIECPCGEAFIEFYCDHEIAGDQDDDERAEAAAMKRHEAHLASVLGEGLQQTLPPTADLHLRSGVCFRCGQPATTAVCEHHNGIPTDHETRVILDDWLAALPRWIRGDVSAAWVANLAGRPGSDMLPAVRELERLTASPVEATPPVEDLIRRWNVDAILAADRAYGSLRPGEREGNWYAMDRRHASFIASWLEAKDAYAVDSSDTPKGSHAVR